MNTQNLILNSVTKKDYRAIIKNPSHAIGIYGVSGIGKTFVAKNLASDLLKVDFDKLYLQPYFRVWAPDEKGTIKLENALEILAFLKLKTIGDQEIRRIVLIEHADSATNEAQNALLKIIEEPPLDTVIILTADSEFSLLATIRSRLRGLQIRKPTKVDMINHFSKNLDIENRLDLRKIPASSELFRPAKTNFSVVDVPTGTSPPDKIGFNSLESSPERDEVLRKSSIDKLYLMSMGLPGLFFAIATNNNDHPVASMVQASKQILMSDSFTRLCLIDKYSDRKDSLLLVDSLGQIAQIGLETAAKSGNTKSVVRWHGILKNILIAQNNLNSSGSPKLVLADLFLHI